MESSDYILTTLIVLTYSMIGACMGSFASAIAHRIAHNKSWIIDKALDSGTRQPARSSCPSCGHQLSVFDLIPVLSWVFLGGKCRYCKVAISARYPAIEMLGVVLMAAFFFTGAGSISLVIFVITLPFCLALILLTIQRARVPVYIYGLFFSNIFVLLYAVLWGNQNI